MSVQSWLYSISVSFGVPTNYKIVNFIIGKLAKIQIQKQ